MLLAEYSSVSEEVLDAVAEVTNMIIGNVKSNLERHLGPLGLSIPTVVFGRNFKTKTAGAEWIEERFRWDGEELVLRVSLRPNERTGTTAATPEVCAMGL
jgi:chemotaxis protein CheX